MILVAASRLLPRSYSKQQLNWFSSYGQRCRRISWGAKVTGCWLTSQLSDVPSYLALIFQSVLFLNDQGLLSELIFITAGLSTPIRDGKHLSLSDFPFASNPFFHLIWHEKKGDHIMREVMDLFMLKQKWRTNIHQPWKHWLLDAVELTKRFFTKGSGLLASKDCTFNGYVSCYFQIQFYLDHYRNSLKEHYT